tara:strand:+ start:64883 stop:66925 length:2043 start_codon:yes stop_codon:yes gene_type:complete
MKKQLRSFFKFAENLKKLTPLKSINNKNFLILVLLCSGVVATAQGPGSLFVDAGSDQTIPCDQVGSSVTLTADFLETFETISEEYTVSTIPYNPPFSFDGLANQLNPNFDDRWSVVEDLPFDFCFFGNLEQQFQVGSNGVLRFEVDPDDITNAWSFDQDLPNNTQDALSEANVFTPVHDIDPSVSTVEEIGYEVLGEYPNRVLVVAYFEVPMFSCNDLLATHMAVFYEFSNVIEIYIQDKPVCPSWNDGNAALGIQNNAGTVAYVPPGRNTSDSPWEATNEAWQFSPEGLPTFVFEWLDSDGNVVSTDTSITVTPDGEETYTARVTYTNSCNGDVVVLTDDVSIFLDNSISVDLGPDQSFCDVDSFEIVPTITGADPNDVTYLWSTGETTPTITVSTTDTYSVEVSLADCTVEDAIFLEFNESPAIELGDNFETCFENAVSLDATPSNYAAGDVTYAWSLDGDPLAETGPELEVLDYGTYSVTVAAGDCESTDSITISPIGDLEVSLGAPVSGCESEEVILTAETSETDVTFTWFLNGTIIDGETSNTLTITLPDTPSNLSDVYRVEIQKGDCSGSAEVEATALNCVISQGISPNGDNMNDCFDLQFLNNRSGVAMLSIFNRYGIVVYEQDNYSDEWCGQSSNGDELPTGTYFYVIRFTENDPTYGSEATGWVYINRDSN